MSTPENEERAARPRDALPKSPSSESSAERLPTKGGVRNGLCEKSLISDKDANRLLRAITRRFENDFAWLLSPEAVLRAEQVCTLPQFGGSAGGIVLGTLLFAITFAILDLADRQSEWLTLRFKDLDAWTAARRIKSLSFNDRFNELHAAVFSFSRGVIR